MWAYGDRFLTPHDLPVNDYGSHMRMDFRVTNNFNIGMEMRSQINSVQLISIE